MAVLLNASFLAKRKENVLRVLLFWNNKILSFHNRTTQTKFLFVYFYFLQFTRLERRFCFNLLHFTKHEPFFSDTRTVTNLSDGRNYFSLIHTRKIFENKNLILFFVIFLSCEWFSE